MAVEGSSVADLLVLALLRADEALTAAESGQWDAVAAADLEIRQILQRLGMALDPAQAQGQRIGFAAISAADPEPTTFDAGELEGWFAKLAQVRERHQQLLGVVERQRAELVDSRRDLDRARAGVEAYAGSE